MRQGVYCDLGGMQCAASSLQFQVVPSGHLRFQSVALKALQEAAEAFLVTLFEDRYVIDI